LYANNYGIWTAVFLFPNIPFLTTQRDGEAVGILTFPCASTISSGETSEGAGSTDFSNEVWKSATHTKQLRMKTAILLVIAIQLFTQESYCQYNIIRVNPFKQLSETLKTHHEEECEGDVMSLQCPEGTKV
jgi:hypothetical protein